MIRFAIAAPILILAVASSTRAQTPAAPSSSVTKKCDTVQRRVAKEERVMKSVSEAIDNERRARQSCPSKTVCDRYDQTIKALEARKQRHDTRLGKFKSDAEKTCKPG